MEHKIKNFGALAVSPLRKYALEIVEAGLNAIDTTAVIEQNVKLDGDTMAVAGEKIRLDSVNRLLVIGVGKCALEAGRALERILGGYISDGVVVDVHSGTLGKIRAYTGTHPIPTSRNIDATKEIISLLGGLTIDDLVIFVISGGGSTLLCQPTNFTCKEEAEILLCLTEAGADIREINTVRKHLSLARGGNLARYAHPARVISLVFSDVPGNDMEFVASGPTVKDTTTVKDAERVISKYDPERRCGITAGELMETPKEDKYFDKVRNVLVVTNETALDAMRRTAETLGFMTKIITAKLTGEASEAGKRIIEDLRRSQEGSALLYGGETMVTLKKGVAGRGRGGRNQEVVLSALRFIGERMLVIALASDGRDNTEYAGAICDMITREKAERLKLDIDASLERHTSYDFFRRTSDQILTGDTGSNVSDLIIALRAKRQ